MTAVETVNALRKRLLEAYKARHEADELIKTVSAGLQGVDLGRAALAEEQIAERQAQVRPEPAPEAGWDANGAPA